MTTRRTITCWLALLPAVAAGQPTLTDLPYLRNKAATDGDVDVKVITRVVANRARSSQSTDAQRIDEQRAQHKLVIALVRQGLLVGNGINMNADGSFTMRVLPEGIDQLAAHPDIAEISAVSKTEGARQ